MISAAFRDEDIGFEIYKEAAQRDCENSGYSTTDKILYIEADDRVWGLRWIIQQLAPHLGRDQELRAYISFGLAYASSILPAPVARS